MVSRRPGEALLVEHGAAPGTPADQRDPFPIYTALQGLGMSPNDVMEVGDDLLRRVRAKIILRARQDDDAGDRFRYLNDRSHRQRVNEQATADAMVEMGFDSDELRQLTRALGLPVEIVSAEKKGPKTATAQGADGPETFEFVEEPEHGEVGPTVLRSLRDGKVHKIQPEQRSGS